MKKVLVTGATGAIGPILVKLLISKGYMVRIMTRKYINIPQELGKIECEIGDITDPESANRAVSGVSIVFHLAAMLHHNNPDTMMEKEFYKVNVKGTENLFRASQNSGVSRFVFFSTISVYQSENANTLIYEDDAINPRTYYEKTKYQAERLISNDFKEKTSPEITILRLASVYGTRVKGNYRTMIKSISKGFFICPGSGLNKRTLVHEMDAARAALMVSEHPDAIGKIYNITDGTVHTIRDIVTCIAAGLNRKIITVYLPSYALDCIKFVIRKSGLSNLPFFRYLIGLFDKMNENVAVSGDKIMKELNFHPKWDLSKGMTDILQHFQ